MTLIIGIGNPEKKYANTRHNVGYMVVDSLSKGIGYRVQGVVIKKTDVFMNDSGTAVKKIMENGKWKLENLYVVHDDLDIPLGQFKIQFGKGPKDHNGIKSVEEELGTKDFWRVRIGIENRDSANRIPGVEYTLQDFEPEERKVIDKVIGEVWQIFKRLETS